MRSVPLAIEIDEQPGVRCPACKGTGVDLRLMRAAWAAEGRVGHDDEPPCTSCGGIGEVPVAVSGPIGAPTGRRITERL